MVNPLPRVNILYLTSSSGLYGGNRCLLNLLQSLDFRFKPIVLLPDSDPLEDKLKELGIKYYRINMPVIEKSYNPLKNILFLPLVVLSVLEICRIIKKENIKILHTNTSLIITGAIAARLMGIKNVWHIREIITQGIVRKVLAWIIYCFSDKIIVMSEAVKKSFFRKRETSKKIIMIYEGIASDQLDAQRQAEKIRREYNLDRKLFIVGSVGRITPWKGQDDFITAANIVLKERQDVRFFVVGGICPKGIRQVLFKNRLIRMVKKFKIDDKIIFTGFRENVSGFMGVFDVFVLPSKKPEPFGMVILEAMNMAKPVIATNIGGPPEIIKDTQGILVSPRAPEEIAQAIIALLKDDKKRIVLGNAAKEYVKGAFNIGAFRQQIGNLYEGILN